MNELIDEKLFNFFEGLRQSNFQMFGLYISIAKSLAAFFTLIYFGLEAYKMMAGDKRLEIMPLLRPFALGLLLMFWIPFLNLIDAPINAITTTAKTEFMAQNKAVNTLARKRFALTDQVAKRLLSRGLEVERAEDQSKDKEWTNLGIDFSIITDKIAGLYLYVVARMRMMFYGIIEFICISIWQVCVYAVFFIQIVFSGILAILGPLAIAFSILPAYRDAFTQWLSRYISVCLYSTIAYLILALSLKVMNYGIQKEIGILQQAMSDEAAFVMYTAMSSGGINSLIITCLLGAIAMASVPTISTWIISTSGTGSAIQGMVNGAKTAAGGAMGGL